MAFGRGGRFAMMRGAGMGMANMYVTLGLIDLVSPAVKGVNKNVAAWAASMGKVQRKSLVALGALNTVVRTFDMIGLVSVASLGAMAAGYMIASKAVIGFEQQLVNMNSILMTSQEEMWGLGQRAVALSTMYNKSADDIAAGLYHLASAGLSYKEIMDVLTPTLQLAVATQGDYAKIAKDVIQVIKGFEMEMSEAVHVADVMIWTIQHSLVTWDKLGEGIKFAMPWFTAAGLTFEELAAAVGVLTDRALEAGIGGRGLRQSLAMLIREASSNAEAFEEMGFSIVDATGNIRPLLEILKEFRALHPEMNVEAIAEMMELLGIRGATAFSHLVVGMEEFEYKLQGVEQATNLVGKVADKQMESTSAKLTILRNKLTAPFKTQAFAEQVGNLVEMLSPIVETIGPALIGLMTKVGDTLKWVLEGGIPLQGMFVTLITLVSSFAKALMWKNGLLLKAGLYMLFLNRVMGISIMLQHGMAFATLTSAAHMHSLSTNAQVLATQTAYLSLAQMGLRGALGGTALALMLFASGNVRAAWTVGALTAGVTSLAIAIGLIKALGKYGPIAGPIIGAAAGIAIVATMATAGRGLAREREKMEAEIATQKSEIERIRSEARTFEMASVPPTAIGHDGGSVEKTGWAYIKKGEEVISEEGVGPSIEINIDLRNSVVTNDTAKLLAKEARDALLEEWRDMKRMRK